MTHLSYVTRQRIPKPDEQTPSATKYATSKGGLLETIQDNRETLTAEIEARIERDIRPPLDSLKSRYGTVLPWDQISGAVAGIDYEDHLTRALSAFESLMSARSLLNLPDSCPCISHEEISRSDLTGDGDSPIVRVVCGLMLPPRIAPPGEVYIGYTIDHFADGIDLFEDIEELLPQAGYRALIPPGKPGSDVSTAFYDTPKTCLKGLTQFRDCAKKYMVFDRGFRDKSAYSVQVEIAGVKLDLELWLHWDPKRMEIRKGMDQGASLPPTKVIELLERDEELEVVAVRIPRWLKNRLQDEAEDENEQLGTHLRERLEDIYQ